MQGMHQEAKTLSSRGLPSRKSPALAPGRPGSAAGKANSGSGLPTIREATVWSSGWRRPSQKTTNSAAISASGAQTMAVRLMPAPSPGLAPGRAR
jgi:hypothetical protein